MPIVSYASDHPDRIRNWHMHVDVMRSVFLYGVSIHLPYYYALYKNLENLFFLKTVISFFLRSSPYLAPLFLYYILFTITMT